MDNESTQNVTPDGTAHASGDFLMVDGVGSGYTHKVKKQAGDAEPRYIAQYDVAANDTNLKRAMQRGVTKVTCGAILATGADFGIKDNVIVAVDATHPKKGFTISSFAAVGDLGLVYFDGGL